jgi:hypothetical protein
MKDDRLRVPIDVAFVEALGRATYVFATLEWNAVWCCERMQGNYIRELRRKTAGVIADDLVHLAQARPDPKVRTACLKPAQEFKRLVDLRNGILHGKPGSTPTGEQRLFRDGSPWTPAMIDDAADQFASCSFYMLISLKEK